VTARDGEARAGAVTPLAARTNVADAGEPTPFIDESQVGFPDLEAGRCRRAPDGRSASQSRR